MEHYIVQISANLFNLDEQSLTATTRTFTTMGTFIPPGIIAHYTFEGIPDDIQNDFDPLVTGVIDIDYTRVEMKMLVWQLPLMEQQVLLKSQMVMH